MVTQINPPTSHLPSIKKIARCPPKELSAAVNYLRSIYNPEVRGTRRIRAKHTTSPYSSSASSSASSLRVSPTVDDTTLLDELRADAFERSYAIKWLTALVASLTAGMPPEVNEAEVHERKDGPTDGERSAQVERETLIHSAASLLAVCAGTASAGKLTRLFRFLLPSRSHEAIEVQLTDAPLENHDYASVGAQTWGSACLLAEMLVEDPERFGLVQRGGGEDGASAAVDSCSCLRAGRGRGALRVLELGAGTGLVSLTLAKWWESQFNAGREEACMSHIEEDAEAGEVPVCDSTDESRIVMTRSRAPCCCCTVVATDFHPSVLANLRENIEANFSPDSGANIFTADSSSKFLQLPSAPTPSLNISAHFLDWSEFSQVSARDSSDEGGERQRKEGRDESEEYPHDHPPLSLSPPFDKPFDLVFGADIIYESEHAHWIKSCLERLLRKPLLPEQRFSLSPYVVPEEHGAISGNGGVNCNGGDSDSGGNVDIDANTRSSHCQPHPLAQAHSDSDLRSHDETMNTSTAKQMQTQPRFHLVIPLRPTHTTESRTIEEVFPFSPSYSSSHPSAHASAQHSAYSQQPSSTEVRPRDVPTSTPLYPGAKRTAAPSDLSDEPISLSSCCNGDADADMRPGTGAGQAPTVSLRLAILSKERIMCEPESDLAVRGGRAEVEYVHYVIGWTWM